MQRIYALIDKPMGHSLSADYFDNFFDSQGIDARYILQELDDLSALRPWLESNLAIVRLNMASPYRVEVCNYLDHIDPEVKYVGAVSTIVVDRTDGRTRLFSYSMDVQDIVEILQPLLVSERQHASVLGTSDAVQTVVQALKRLDHGCTLVSRGP